MADVNKPADAAPAPGQEQELPATADASQSPNVPDPDAVNEAGIPADSQGVVFPPPVLDVTSESHNPDDPANDNPANVEPPHAHPDHPHHPAHPVHDKPAAGEHGHSADVHGHAEEPHGKAANAPATGKK